MGVLGTDAVSDAGFTDLDANCPGPIILIFQSSCRKSFCGVIIVDALSIVERCRGISCCCQFAAH